MDKNGTLYTYAGNFRALKVLLGASYASTKIEISPSFVFGETNKTEEFVNKFGTQRVPTYESKDGKVRLTQSDAIAYYVADEKLKGKDEVTKAKILQWISFAQTELVSPIQGWLFPSLSIMQYNKDQVAKAKLEVERLLHYLDNHLLTRTYFVGESITLADLSIFATLFETFKYLVDEENRKLFVNLTRWFDTILNQPKVKDVLAKHNFEFAYCKTVAKFDPNRLKEITAAQGEQHAKPKKEKAEKKKEEKAAKQEKPPKEEKKKEEPQEELDETEAALAAEPKSKDPLDALPKGNWVMDDFKRFYSNNDVDKSIPYFWEHFDSENYSIWIGEYKYNHELTKVFMSCNLITGMYQRLDKMRKNAFASVALFGEDNNSTISGIWVWRGQELAFSLNPDWQVDYESYDWKKLDAKSEETKKLVQDYFSWEGTDKEGRKFNQGKIFK